MKEAAAKKKDDTKGDISDGIAGRVNRELEGG
jgi:hypothetical protein